MFEVLVLPYRDLYFWKKYGSAVRDLQFIELLKEHPSVSKLHIVNRPVSLYERFLNKKNNIFDYPNVDVHDVTDKDLFGPLKKREWTVTCYNKYLNKIINDILNSTERKLIVIDFTPFAKLKKVENERVYYWYDMIDNFTKHNCFSEREKELVREKYSLVACEYDFLTAVSFVAAEAVTKFKSLPYSVVTNGVFNSKFQETHSVDLNEQFDFGFVGFVTDKFDVDTVIRLAKKYKVVVYGEVYNKNVAAVLQEGGIVLKGPFKYTQLNDIIKTFKVGLLPYLLEKSHDGSPLKMYEYFKYNIPCITSIDYELVNEYVVNYNATGFNKEVIDKLLAVSGKPCISQALPENTWLKYKLNLAFEKFSNLESKND